MTMQRHLKLYRLPDRVKTKGLRKMKATDVPEACMLLNEVERSISRLERASYRLTAHSSRKVAPSVTRKVTLAQETLTFDND